MNIKEKVVGMVRKFLRIESAQVKNIVLREQTSYENNLLINKLWYRGDAALLDQAFKAISKNANAVAQSRFWAIVPSKGMGTRKIHTGLPGIVVDILSDIIISDMNDIKLKDPELQKVWDEIDKENKIKELIKSSIIETLVSGDGAFKFSYDSTISQYPIIEFYSGDQVDYEYNRGRLTDTIFYTDYVNDKKIYTLKETYTKLGVFSELYLDDKVIPLNAIPQTAGLEEFVPKKDMYSVQSLYWKSAKFDGRGKSLYDNKWETFDSYDESWSQFKDSERAGRAHTYIPSDMLPKDPETGATLEPNPFDNGYSELAEGINLETGKIQVTQAQIYYQAHQAAINSGLDLCLQGIISPATLGINIAANSSGESQKEKKDITGITRNHVTTCLEKIVKELVVKAINLYFEINNKPVRDNIDVEFGFGEYGAQDFSERIATLVSARPGSSVMSVEAQVDELWGDSKDEEWKKAEVERLKNESGLNTVIDETPFPTDKEILE